MQQATKCTFNDSGAAINIDLGLARLEFERMLPLADCELGFTLEDGSKGNMPCHKTLLAQNSNVLGYAAVCI